MGVTELHVLGKSPYNAEPPSLAALTSHPITPLHLVYARNHCTFLPNYDIFAFSYSSTTTLFVRTPCAGAIYEPNSPRP